MNILHTNKLKLLSTGLIVFVVTVLATQSSVHATTVKLAQAAQQKEVTSLLSELTRRSEEINKSTLALNGEKTSTTAATGTDAKECSQDDPKTKQAIDEVNKDSAKTSSDLQTLLGQAKQSTTADATKKTTAETESKYEEYKIANAQNNIMNTVCTQKDAQQQLETLIGQAQQQESEASSEGGDTGNTEEMIQKIIQLVAAAAAILASVVALVMAIQSGDYAAASAILLTIMGQLVAVANILLDGQGDMEGIVQSLSTIQ